MERHRNGVKKRDEELRFFVVDEKNALKNLKQKCDMIRFLSSERTTPATAQRTPWREERIEAGRAGQEATEAIPEKEGKM